GQPPGEAPAGPVGGACGRAGFGGGGFGRRGGGMPSRSAILKDLEYRSRGLKQQANTTLNSQQTEAGNKVANDAAALDQYRDLLLTKEEIQQAGDAWAGGAGGDGPSVTYALKTKMTLPSRNDDQVIEIARVD